MRHSYQYAHILTYLVYFLNTLFSGKQEGKTGPGWELAPVGRGKDMKKGCRRVNMVEALCSHG
jgi:hypothetical protein